MIAKFQKAEFGGYEVIDTRNGEIVKRNIKTASYAAAYVTYYEEEIEKAEVAFDG